MIRKPIRYEVRPVNGPGLPGELFIEGERADLRWVYLQAPDIQRAFLDIYLRIPEMRQALFPLPQFMNDPFVPVDPYGARNLAVVKALTSPGAGAGSIPQGVRVAVAATPSASRPANGRNNTQAAEAMSPEIIPRLERIQASIDVSRQQLVADVECLDGLNARSNQLNSQVLPVLSAVTGQNLGVEPDDWKSWWADQRGYVYDRPELPSFKPVLTQVVPNPVSATIELPHVACFAAGTSVRTIDGLKPIEVVKVGDQVLAQNVTTGRLMFTPVVAVFHNKPTATCKVQAGDKMVVATGIHRFWKANHGWVMVRELKPGDMVRTIGGTARIASVETDETQPVFNLEVGDGASFFVGRSGVLVHDNSIVWPVSQPFDAPPDLAALTAPEAR